MLCVHLFVGCRMWYFSAGSLNHPDFGDWNPALLVESLIPVLVANIKGWAMLLCPWTLWRLSAEIDLLNLLVYWVLTLVATMEDLILKLLDICDSPLHFVLSYLWGCWEAPWLVALTWIFYPWELLGIGWESAVLLTWRLMRFGKVYECWWSLPYLSFVFKCVSGLEESLSILSYDCFDIKRFRYHFLEWAYMTITLPACWERKNRVRTALCLVAHSENTLQKPLWVLGTWSWRLHRLFWWFSWFGFED